MDVKEFQIKLNGLMSKALDQKKYMNTIQVKEFFADSPLDDRQLDMVYKYLMSQGVVVEGAAQTEEVSDQEKDSYEAVPLTAEEEEYMREYEAGLPRTMEEPGVSESLFGALAQGDRQAVGQLARIFQPEICRLCRERNHPDLFIGDLLQEVNVSLLLALEDSLGQARDFQWLCRAAAEGIDRAVSSQTQQKFQDQVLVTKVQNLEAAVRELTEDDQEGENKFSMGELAVILDMDVEEIRDILRLTGDDK